MNKILNKHYKVLPFPQVSILPHVAVSFRQEDVLEIHFVLGEQGQSRVGHLYLHPTSHTHPEMCEIINLL